MDFRRSNVRLLGGVSLFALVSLGGCAAVGPDFKAPEAPAVDSYTAKPISTLDASPEARVTRQTVKNGVDIPAQWWELFKSPKLNALVLKALAHNQNLAAADASLRAAQENYNAQRGGLLFPSVGLSANDTRLKSFTFDANGNPIITSPYNLYNASVNVNYKLDVFGGSRRALEGSSAQTEFQNFQLEGAYLTLTSNVVTAAIRLASFESQYQATEKILTSQKKIAEVLEKQLEIGTISRIELNTQKNLVATSEITLLGLEKNINIVKNQLSTYLGEFPSQSRLDKLDLDDLILPEELPVSLPSKLVEQRPDIRAALAQMKLNNALVGVATANLLPQINLSASMGFQAIDSAALFGPASSLWSIAGGIFQPLFQGGQLTAQRRAASANLDQSVFLYQATVLGAFQEVANALNSLDTGSRSLKSTVDAYKFSADSLNLVQQQYQLGTSSYLTLLTVENNFQNAQIQLIQARADRYTDSAALFAALGGGWWNRSEVAYQTPVKSDSK